MDFEDKYQVLNLLGNGTSGMVYKAIRRSTGQEVAVKVFIEEEDDDIDREIELLVKMSSPFIVSFLEAIKTGSKVWIIMECFDCGSLGDVFKLRRRSLNEDQCKAAIASTLLGLHHIHSLRCLHRDIKADNLLLSAGGVVKLADFGVSAELNESFNERTSTVGTPHWMSPELISGQGYDTSVDIWSLGITLIELCEGQPPNCKHRPSKVVTVITTNTAPKFRQSKLWSADMEDFLDRCLQKNPRHRASTTELINHPWIRGTIEDVLVNQGSKVLCDLFSEVASIKAALAEVDSSDSDSDATVAIAGSLVECEKNVRNEDTGRDLCAVTLPMQLTASEGSDAKMDIAAVGSGQLAQRNSVCGGPLEMVTQGNALEEKSLQVIADGECLSPDSCTATPAVPTVMIPGDVIPAVLSDTMPPPSTTAVSAGEVVGAEAPHDPSLERSGEFEGKSAGEGGTVSTCPAQKKGSNAGDGAEQVGKQDGKVSLSVPPSLSGVLQKRGKITKLWKDKFFVLENGVLSYYSNISTRSNRKAMYPFSASTVLHKHSTATPLRNVPVCGMSLEDTSLGWSLVVKCCDSNTTADWVSHIQEHIRFSAAYDMVSESVSETKVPPLASHSAVVPDTAAGSNTELHVVPSAVIPDAAAGSNTELHAVLSAVIPDAAAGSNTELHAVPSAVIPDTAVGSYIAPDYATVPGDLEDGNLKSRESVVSIKLPVGENLEDRCGTCEPEDGEDRFSVDSLSAVPILNLTGHTSSYSACSIDDTKWDLAVREASIALRSSTRLPPLSSLFDNDVLPHDQTDTKELIFPMRRTGWMLKCSEFLQLWSRRYFVMEQGVLTYLHNEKRNAIGIMRSKAPVSANGISYHFSSYTKIALLESQGCVISDPFHNWTVTVKFESVADRDDWMDCFETSIAVFLPTVKVEAELDLIASPVGSDSPRTPRSPHSKIMESIIRTPDDPPSLQGWAQKCSNYLHNWNNRYFVLERAMITFYYDDKADETARKKGGTYVLTKRTRLLLDATPEYNIPPCAVVLIDDDAEWMVKLKYDSEKTKANWVKHIRSHLMHVSSM